MLTDLLKTLQEDPRFAARIEHIEVLPAKHAVYGKLDPELPGNIQLALHERGIRLYTHQCDAVRALREGKNVVITTPTASGKTLAFNVPVFERLDRVPGATALYLYPTKALSNDQLSVLKEFEHLTATRINPEIYDGDTPSGRRARIRNSSQIIVSNPHELHQVLAYHSKWDKFFSGLSFIVVDEAHRYRGVLGSNVACLLRRLRRLCNYYGSNPQFVLSTATIANPVDFAQILTGTGFELIDNDGSPRGTKYFVLYNPYFRAKELFSTHQETKDLFVAFLRGGLQTLCFTVSRRMAELIALWARDALKETDPELAARISPYRAGYLPGERRDIEQRLKKGILKGITSTNALEVGIDVGSLDSVIISGYPGTMITTWQQAGRAGRRNSGSVAALVAFQNPLDQYYMKHPKVFFGKPSEWAIVDPDNMYVLSGHLLCAAAELPVTPADEPFFGPQTAAILDTLGRDYLVSHTPVGWVYTGRARAAEVVALDKIGGDIFKVVCDGRIVETMDKTQAFREAHQGAVLLHHGETYVVQRLDLDSCTVHAGKMDVDYYTQALKVADIRVVGILDRKVVNGFDIHYGELEVTERYTGYKIMKGDSAVGMQKLDLPPVNFKTTGFWLTLAEELEEVVWENRRNDADIAGLLLEKPGSGIGLRKTVFGGGLHGVEHAMIGIMPLHVMCDRWDIGGISTPFHPDTLGPAIFIYDGYEGGIGLAEKAYELFIPLTATTFSLIQDCGCETGCPACVYSPKCGNGNKPLDKKAALLLLGEITGAGGETVPF